MSGSYDSWRTESDMDRDERLGTHAGEEGRCACGTVTEWTTDGEWECDECGAVRMERENLTSHGGMQ